MNKKGAALLLLLVLLFPVSSPAEEDQTVEIRVAKDDTLSHLCIQYLEDPGQCREIATLNRLKDPDRINPGQILLIPVRLLKGTPIPGVVTFQKGEVAFQEKTGEWRELRLGDPVVAGSQIRTGEESAVEITFENGAVLFAQPNTIMKIKRSEKKGMLHTIQQLFLELGKVLIRSQGATGKASRFEIETPAAVIAPRGTTFRVAADPSRITAVEVLEEKVAVTAMSETVSLNENEGTIVEKGTPPLPPVTLLSPPALIDPAPEYQTLPLRFHFEIVENAVSYRHILAKDPDLKDRIAEEIVDPKSPFTVASLEEGLYYLSSQSINHLGLEGRGSKPVEIRMKTAEVALPPEPEPETRQEPDPVPPPVAVPRDYSREMAGLILFILFLLF